MAEDAGLLAELRADSKAPSRGCQTCNWIARQDNAETWNTAIRDPLIATAAIARAMKNRGFLFSESAIGKHRRDHRG